MRIPIIQRDIDYAEGQRLATPPEPVEPPPPDPVEEASRYWIDQQDTKTQVGSAEIKMLSTVNQNFEQAKQQAAPGAHGFTPMVLDAFDQYYKEQSDALPPDARPYFREKASALRDDLGKQAIGFEAQSRLTWRATAYTQSADQWAAQVAHNSAYLPLALESLHETLPHLDPEQRASLGSYARNAVVQAGAESALAQDAPAFLRALGGTPEDVGSPALAGNGNKSTGAGTPAATEPEIDPDHPVAVIMTPEERAHYREVTRMTVLQQQATQREELKTRTIQASSDYLATGRAANPPSQAEFVASLGQEEGERQFLKLQDDALAGKARQSLLLLPADRLQRLRESVPMEGDTDGLRNYQAMNTAIDGIEKERKQDPLGFALKNKSYGLTAISNFADAAPLGAELGRRSRAAGSVAGDYAVAPPVFSKEESQKLVQTLQALPPGGQRDLLRQIADGLDDGELMETAMRGISAEAKVQALAGVYVARDAAREKEMAGEMLWGGSGKEDVPGQMLNGEAKLHPTTPDTQAYVLPNDALLSSTFNSRTGDAFSAEPGRAQVYLDSAKAIYAALDPRKGSEVLDEERWAKAVDLATDREWGRAAADTLKIEGTLTNGPRTDVQSNLLVPLNARADLEKESEKSGRLAGLEQHSDEGILSGGILNASSRGPNHVEDGSPLPVRYAYNELSGLPVPDVGSAQGLNESRKSDEKANGPLNPGMFENDKEHAYTTRVIKNIATPPDGTSNTAVSELPKASPGAIKRLIERGPGHTLIADVKEGPNSFVFPKLPRLPEEYTSNPNDPTHHKYGLLTYLGKTDEAKGVTKDNVVGLLVDRRTRPGYQLNPVPPAFSTYNNVYSTNPLWTVGNSAIGNENVVNNPKNYTHEIGSVAQVRVNDGIVNITATDHEAYPGTVRRTVIEVDGHLFVYTQGVGENRSQNKPIVGIDSVVQPGSVIYRQGERIAGAWGNQKFGPQAFEMVDKGLFEDIERLRKGLPLEPVDMTPVKLPPAFIFNNPRRGVE